MRLAAIWLAVCGCGFRPTVAVGGGDDAMLAHDAHAIDAVRDDAVVDGVPDAERLPAATFVQTFDPTYINNSSVTIALSETAGDVLIVAVYASLDTATFTVTDTAGLVWTSVPAIPNTNCGTVLQLWYAPVTATGTNQITGSQSGFNFMGMSVSEYAGVGAVDTVAGMAAPASATDMATAGTVTTTHPAMVFAAFIDNNGSGTIVPGTGWTERIHEAFYYTLMEDNVPGVLPGAYVPTATLPRMDNCWTAAAIALRTI